MIFLSVIGPTLKKLFMFSPDLVFVKVRIYEVAIVYRVFLVTDNSFILSNSQYIIPFSLVISEITAGLFMHCIFLDLHFLLIYSTFYLTFKLTENIWVRPVL